MTDSKKKIILVLPVKLMIKNDITGKAKDYK